ncbi:MAG: hypothetical protein ACREVS_13500 [Burkholderiales bacterium]
MNLRNLCRWLLCGLAGAVVASTASAQAGDDKEPKLAGFTCCNLHYENDWISDANWSSLPMIPAGQPARITDYGRYRIHVDIDGKNMRLGLDYGRSEPLGQFARKIVVAQDPKAKIATWPAGVQEAVKLGKIAVGMTKEQVIVSLGYPPLHQTPSLDVPVWKYWLTRVGTFLVVWDDKGRVRDVTADAVTRATVLLEKR